MPHKPLIIRYLFLILCLPLCVSCLKGSANFTEDKDEENPNEAVVNPPQVVLPPVQLGSAVEYIVPKYTVGSGALLDTTIEVLFKQPMNVASVNTAISLKLDGDVIALEPVLNDQTAKLFTYQPTKLLTPDRLYTVAIDTRAKNADGKAIPEKAGATFSTRKLSVQLSPVDSTLFNRGKKPCCFVTTFASGNSGIMDIISANENGISHYANNGAGEFVPSTILQLSDASQSIVGMLTGDFNRDNLLDLVAYSSLAITANSSIYAVSTFLNQSATTPKTPFTAGNRRTTNLDGITKLGNKMLAADFNQDGNLETVVMDVQSAPARVMILGGVGSGLFTTPKEIRLNGIVPTDIAITDFNQDEKPDLLVVSSASANCSIFLGTGNSEFTALTPINLAGMTPSQVAAFDMDADNFPDVAVADSFGNQVVVLKNDRKNGLSITSKIDVGKIPSAILAGKFNFDEFKDLAVANKGENTVTILLGNGSGGFSKSGTIASGTEPYALSLGNIDGLETDEILVTNSSGTSISLLYGNAQGTFYNQTNIAAGAKPSATASLEINQDGYPDLVVANQTDHTLSVLFGNGTGGFERGQLINLGTNASPIGFAEGDFNNDGNIDLAALNLEGSVSIIQNSGKKLSLAGTVTLIGKTPTQIIAADFNNDGAVDLAINASGSGAIYTILNQGQMFAINTQIATNTGSTPISLATGLFNEDTNLDIAVLNRGSSSLSIMYGDGSGRFVTNQNESLPTIFKDTEIPGNSLASFNGSSNKTYGLVVAIDNLNFYVYRNENGSFSLIKTQVLPAISRDLRASDVNGDGIADLVVTMPDFINVWIDEGKLTFPVSQKTQFATGSRPLRPSVADFNNNKSKDIALPQSDTNEVTLFFQK